jgi:indolepyruvate ferredoxin oxidoreductase, alpha subunit
VKQLMTGNEAVARGAYEAGIVFASAYPGTPSTEILENMALYKDEIVTEWACNEKVALETAIGASIAGARAIAAMKHVGVNVAADPLMTFAYTGVNGGMILVSADDPGMHSSQNEQDNRYYAKFAKIAMLEPSDSQESKDMVKIGMEISEQFNVPVMLRMTTRVCHSKTLVESNEPIKRRKLPYIKDVKKNISIPSHSKVLREQVEIKLRALENYANETELNTIEWNGTEVGIISSGIAYQYAKEVFGEKASYLKLGFTYPLPMKKIRDFANQVKRLYVIEELEPFIEEQIQSAGIQCIGKAEISSRGELNPDILMKSLKKIERQTIKYSKEDLAGRPPVLCAGCPHRGFFYELSKNKNVMVTGDIGCYTLGAMSPLNSIDSVICMGSSISTGHGAQKIFAKFDEGIKVVSVIGDSTFFHTGINSLMNSVYNKSNTVICILDNRITGMTGHQENPGTGFTLQGEATKIIEIEPLVKALGVEHVRTISPLNLSEVRNALQWAMELTGPVVLITRWPCVLKNLSSLDKEEFGNYFAKYWVDESKCTGCKMCIKTGCPALQFNKEDKKVIIDNVQCVGCTVCKQVCKFNAIKEVGEN